MRIPRIRSETIEAALLLCALRVGVRVAPASWTGAALRRACASAPDAGRNEASRQIAREVERVASRLPGTTCLMQAMTGWIMLRRRAIPAVVRLGVARNDDRLSAHAWLEHAGSVVLGGDTAAAHTSFPSPPP